MNKTDRCKWYEVCPLKRYCQAGNIDKTWVETYCWGDYSCCERFKLEEKGIYHPDNMMPDGLIKEELKEVQ